MKIKIDPMHLFIGLPLIVLCCSVVLMYEYIYIPKVKENTEYLQKYPIKCLVERNQTVIIISENAKMTLYKPENICQVAVQSQQDDKGNWYHYVKYQYEYQSKYNKTYSIAELDCKAQSFDSLTGQIICINGKVAKEKDIYAQ